MSVSLCHVIDHRYELVYTYQFVDILSEYPEAMSAGIKLYLPSI